LLRKLSEEGCLARFATTLGFASLPRWLPVAMAAELGRRCYALQPEKIWSRPWREGMRMAAAKFGYRGIVRHETGWASVDAVYRDLDRKVATHLPRWSESFGLGVVYGYEDGCADSFAVATKLGLTCVYDLPIAYWETSGRLLQEEAQRWPEWEPTLGGTRDSPAKLARKTRELELADIVICPSLFVANSLPDWARDSKKIVIAPFGSPEASAAFSFQQSAVSGQLLAASKLGEDGSAFKEPSSKLRILFAGSMTQRKGLADVFAAMKLLKRDDVELVVMGTPILPLDFYRRQLPGFIHEPTRPHTEVLKLMATCDVLVLPSIVEGRALVMQEAMSQGLPIIVTPNTGGDDLIEEGQTGFLIPIRSPEAIANRLEIVVAEREERLAAMRRAALEKAAQFTWGTYATTIFESLPASRPSNN